MHSRGGRWGLSKCQGGACIPSQCCSGGAGCGPCTTAWQKVQASISVSTWEPGSLPWTVVLLPAEPVAAVETGLQPPSHSTSCHRKPGNNTTDSQTWFPPQPATSPCHGGGDPRPRQPRHRGTHNPHHPGGDFHKHSDALQPTPHHKDANSMGRQR